jgi:hypothetical protein
VTGTNAPTRVLPRWTGDELVVPGAVKKVYKAFGGGTNDWVRTLRISRCDELLFAPTVHG